MDLARLAFNTLKRRECEVALERILSDEEHSADLADTLALEVRQHQPPESSRQALEELNIRV